MCTGAVVKHTEIIILKRRRQRCDGVHSPKSSFRKGALCQGYVSTNPLRFLFIM